MARCRSPAHSLRNTALLHENGKWKAKIEVLICLLPFALLHLSPKVLTYCIYCTLLYCTLVISLMEAGTDVSFKPFDSHFGTQSHLSDGRVSYSWKRGCLCGCFCHACSACSEPKSVCITDVLLLLHVFIILISNSGWYYTYLSVLKSTYPKLLTVAAPQKSGWSKLKITFNCLDSYDHIFRVSL